MDTQNTVTVTVSHEFKTEYTVCVKRQGSRLFPAWVRRPDGSLMTPRAKAYNAIVRAALEIAGPMLSQHVPPRTVAIPTVHMNGTGAEDLFKQYADACGALRTAIKSLPVPHGRDYYVQPEGAYKQARDEHEARVAVLHKMIEEYQTILESIADQRDARCA